MYEVARFCHHHTRLTLVSKRNPGANLFDPPPSYAGTGRPRVKGPRVSKPRTGCCHDPPRSPHGRPTCWAIEARKAGHAPATIELLVHDTHHRLAHQIATYHDRGARSRTDVNLNFWQICVTMCKKRVSDSAPRYRVSRCRFLMDRKDGMNPLPPDKPSRIDVHANPAIRSPKSNVTSRSNSSGVQPTGGQAPPHPARPGHPDTLQRGDS